MNDDRCNENVIEWLDGSATVSVTYSSRYANKLRRLAEKNPTEVKILAENEDGSIFARVPLKYVKISAPRKVEMTEEDKQKLAERFKEAREKRSASRDCKI